MRTGGDYTSPRAGYIPRKHSKTFTGCWTCRARKVKCDEQRPHCRQCREREIRCEGYGIRLHWMPPENCPSPESTSRVFRAKLQRSRIAYEPREPILQDAEVDEILETIETLDSSKDWSAIGIDQTTHSIKCFSVFRVANHASTRNEFAHHAFQSPDATFLNDHGHSGASVISDAASQAESLTSEVSGACPSTQANDIRSYWDNSSPAQYDYAEDGASINVPGYDSISEVQTFDSPGNPVSLSLADIELAGTSGTQIVYSQWTSSPTEVILRCPKPVHMPALERFLMHHYAHRVVNLFCALDNPKSPWKAIHLPRALQSAGELCIEGSTSRIRGALRNALLSISAFCLSNDNRDKFPEGLAARWANEATVFRGRAIKLLKEAVENDFDPSSRPKYKEFLATMLSMISINVMSGDTDTCALHLDGASKLLSHAQTWKVKYSPKAQALHRIYFYLRTIYDSTAIHGLDASGMSSETNRPRSSSSLATQISQYPEDIVSILSNTTKAKDNATPIATYESIYAVPQSLVVLLNRTINIINEVSHMRQNANATAIPDDLAGYCDELEQEIMDWPDKTELEQDPLSNVPANADIIQHTTVAFHNAIIIYFAQHIRLIGYRYLQPYVQIVLASIEAIERIKAETNILASPLFWPAFIAASETFDGELQGRFQKWYDDVDMYGIAVARTGITILRDVWAEGPLHGKRMSSLWRMVVARSGATLMLT